MRLFFKGSLIFLQLLYLQPMARAQINLEPSKALARIDNQQNQRVGAPKKIKSANPSKIQKDLSEMQRSAVATAHKNSSKKFSKKEVQAQLKLISNKLGASIDDKIIECSDLRDSVAMSKTPAKSKSELLGLIDQQMAALSGQHKDTAKGKSK
jgi:hypothetical protein